MPFLKKVKEHNSVMALWKLTESPEELASLVVLGDTEKAGLERLSLERRKREYLALRILLAGMADGHQHIEYDRYGKPSLPGTGQHISISHSRSLVSVVLSVHPTGIDTEETGRTISGIAGRFLSEEELQWTSAASCPSLAQLFCWCCKEAVYKMMGIQDVEFKGHISVLPEEIKTVGVAAVTFHKSGIQKNVDMKYLVIENNVVTWCVDAI